MTTSKQFHDLNIPSSVGTYLARRMIDVGVKDYFVVPGDFNLILLDEILRFDELRMISCCNELNAGYAADGYARANRCGVVFTTYTVGSLSAINAIAGCYAEDLPVVIIAGAPNSLDYGSDRILHHTLGLTDRSCELKCFQAVTAGAYEINYPRDAASMIDLAFKTAMKEKKPVFLSIACNLALVPVPMPTPFHFEATRKSNPESLKAALAAVTALWKKSVSPSIIVGFKTKMAEARSAVVELSDAACCATAVMPDAKGFFPETHPNFIGTYWGVASSPRCAAVIDNSDLKVYVGPIFSDTTTCGFVSPANILKTIRINKDRIITPNAEFGCVYMAEFVEALAKIIKPKIATMSTYKLLRSKDKVDTYTPNAPGDKLTTHNIMHHIEALLTKDSTFMVDTGDSWFHGQKVTLPEGCDYQAQMGYGSIGWSVGALLGYSVATQGKKRVVALIGDGSFQMTAQELSTMIRYEQNPIIFLNNNDGYTVEVMIHDGLYNSIQMWDYSLLVKCFNGPHGSGNAKCFKAKTEEELVDAVTAAKSSTGLCFIECFTDRYDASAELLSWGPLLGKFGGRQA